MRAYQTGDIVRDASLDDMLPEYQHNQMIFRVVGVAVATEWDPAPLRIHMTDGQKVMQQYLTLERADGQPHFRTLVAQEAFAVHGPRYEVMKSVEEVLAEEFMA